MGDATENAIKCCLTCLVGRRGINEDVKAKAVGAEERIKESLSDC